MDMEKGSSMSTPQAFWAEYLQLSFFGTWSFRGSCASSTGDPQSPKEGLLVADYLGGAGAQGSHVRRDPARRNPACPLSPPGDLCSFLLFSPPTHSPGDYSAEANTTPSKPQKTKMFP